VFESSLHIMGTSSISATDLHILSSNLWVVFYSCEEKIYIFLKYNIFIDSFIDNAFVIIQETFI
jgi:hypothetical protein